MKPPPSLTPKQAIGLVLFGCILASLLLAWGALTLENRSGAQAWESTLRYLAAEGEPLTLASLRPVPVPEEENFFATPLLSALANQKEEDRGPGRLLTLRDVTDVHDLTLPDWKTARLPEFSGMAAAMRRDSAYPVVEESLSPAAQVIAKLEGRFHTEFLELNGAASRPYAQTAWFYDLPVKDRIGAWNPASQSLPEIGRMYRVLACALLSEGKPDDALAAWIVACRIADCFQQPSQFSLMVRVMVFAGLPGPVWQGCATRQWRLEHLEAIERCLARFDFVAEAMNASRAEMLGSIETMDWMKSESPWRAPEVLKPRWVLWLPPGWWDYNKASLARMVYDGSIKPLKLGCRGSVAPTGHSKFRLHALIADRSESSYASVADRTAWTITDLHLVRTGCAVERYFARCGRYPANLADLVPEFLPAPLTDFARGGGPLNYWLSEDGRTYRIYSFGPDGDDDGGVPAIRSGGRWDKREGDWVWTNEIRSSMAAQGADTL